MDEVGTLGTEENHLLLCLLDTIEIITVFTLRADHYTATTHASACDVFNDLVKDAISIGSWCELMYSAAT